jgi:hypothetical protein
MEHILKGNLQSMLMDSVVQAAVLIITLLTLIVQQILQIKQVAKMVYILVSSKAYSIHRPHLVNQRI